MNGKTPLILKLCFVTFVIALLLAVADTIYQATPNGIFVKDVISAGVYLYQSVLINSLFVLLVSFIIGLVVFLVRFRKVGIVEAWSVSIIPAIFLLVLISILMPAFREIAGFSLTFKSFLMLAVSVLVSAGVSVGVYFLARRFYRKGTSYKWLYIPVGVFVLVLISGPVIGLIGEARNAGKRIDSPNVIIISIDTLRRDHFSIYENSKIDTPNLDRFAEKSYVFENSFTVNPWTLPSVMSMLTAQYPSVHGIDTHYIPTDFVTMPEMLRANGYRTEAYIGNWTMLGEYGFEDGFDRYHKYGEIPLLNPLRNTAVARFINRLGYIEHMMQWRDHTTEWCTGKFRNRLRRLSKQDRPYLLWVHYMDPHTPLRPPLEYIEGDLTDDEKRELIRSSKAVYLAGPETPDDKKRIYADLYASETFFVDDCLGDIYGVFDDCDVWDDTIVIIVADHGEAHFEHGIYGHAYALYDEVIAVPIVVYLPGREGGRITEPASIIDVPATVLSYVSADNLPHQEGTDLTSLIDGENTDRYLYCDRTRFDHSAMSVRDDEYLLVYHERDPLDSEVTVDRYELFNYREDPYSLDDISDEYPEKTSELKDQLRLFKEYLEKRIAETEDGTEYRMDKDRKNALKNLGYF
jgi:arylsulfatase A-like enzyme